MALKRVLSLVLVFASLSVARAADSDSLSRNPAYNAIRPRFQPLALQLSRIPAEEPHFGHNLTLFHNGQDKAARLLADLGAAQASIHLSYYHLNNGPFGTTVRDLLTRKAAEGVRVQLIFENQSNCVPARFFTPLREAGADVAYFTPLSRPGRFLRHMNHRNHQKVVVIDNKIAYMGGMNLTDKYLSDWEDTHLRVEGPAAAAMDAPFQDIWKDLRKGFVPSVSIPEASEGEIILQTIGDRALDYQHPLEEALVWALDNAEDYFYALTPYFAPTLALMDALQRAAADGKDVRIILPAFSDYTVMGACHRLYYRRCAKAGIRLYAVPGRFNHGKLFVTDDYLSSTGSMNLDARSLIRNYENNTFIYHTETAGQIRSYLEDTMSSAKEIDPDRLPKLNLYRKLLVVFAWLISAHL